jgi:hypothetical protein
MLKNNMKMFSMIFKIFRIDQNIIDKNYDEFIKFQHEDRVHEIHEICRCIGKAKGHNQIFIESISGGESCFWNITWSNLYLMIPRAKVNFGEYLGSG